MATSAVLREAADCYGRTGDGERAEALRKRANASTAPIRSDSKKAQ
jgi:hypothetical protein